MRQDCSVKFIAAPAPKDVLIDVEVFLPGSDVYFKIAVLQLLAGPL